MSTEEDEGPSERNADEDVRDRAEDEGIWARTKQRVRDSRFVPVYGDEEVSGRRRALETIGVAALGGVGIWGILEANDGDGLELDWNSYENIPAGGVVPPVTEDGTPVPGAAEECVSDELYIQEDGTVVAVDRADEEFYQFHVEDFSQNQGYASLFDELSSQRPQQNLAPGPVDEPGIHVTHNELFAYDRQAYTDMADEAEWDRIFDQNPSYSCAGG